MIGAAIGIGFTLGPAVGASWPATTSPLRTSFDPRLCRHA